MKNVLVTITLIVSTVDTVIGQPGNNFHKKWNALLQKYVNKDGMIDYKGFKSDASELDKLSSNESNSNWSKDQKKAYWINAYNAFTIKLIVKNYPVESIRDLHPTIKIPVNTVWHKKFFKIGGKEMNLHTIEHKILREKFNDPRIHFGINCASFSVQSFKMRPM